MKTIIFLCLSFLIFRLFFYRKFRLWLALRRRKGVYTRVIAKITSLKKYEHRKKSKIPYVGYFGSSVSDAETFYVVTSLAHGLETITAEIHAEVINGISEQDLIDQKICLISIPIVNHWGFLNGARTTENGVDLLRNSPYKTRHKKQRLLLSGWKNPFFWLFAKVLGFSYYFQGFGTHRILKEFYKNILDILKLGKPVIFFDLHTGNNDHRTTVWKHELDTKNFPEYMKKAFVTYNMHAEPISYGTDGAIIEYFVEKFGDYITGYTIEFGVLEKPGWLHYGIQSTFGDVFDPPLRLRNEKMKQGMRQFAALLNLKLKKAIY